MQKSSLFLIVPALLLFLTGCGNKNLTNNQYNTGYTNKATSSTKSYTLSDVAMHNTSTDCWQVINGQVYDLSTYIASDKHPNTKINDGCGKDATAMFKEVAKHNGKAEAMLPEYLLGALQQ